MILAFYAGLVIGIAAVLTLGVIGWARRIRRFSRESQADAAAESLSRRTGISVEDAAQRLKRAAEDFTADRAVDFQAGVPTNRTDAAVRCIPADPALVMRTWR